MFNRILVIAQLTLLEQVRDKIVNLIFLFAGVVVYFGVVLTQLAQGFEERFFRDTALAMVELFGLVLLLGSAYRVVRQDVRKGSSVEMFFVRPLRRWEYLAGRFAGLSTLLLVGMAVMGGVQLGIITFKGFSWHWLFAVSFAELYLKLIIVLALAFLLATITTSQASYLASTLLIYASGHVTQLMKLLIARQDSTDTVSLILLKPLTYLLPDFSFFGTANRWEGIAAGAVSFSIGGLGLTLLYTVIYAGALVVFSSYLFSRAEISPT
ncbi:MAG: hypothetical protein HY401_05295 [Elusimicrobia bacterium]|nr:hypothetical protein [Elusimicrobiota bacterium]